VLLTTPLIRSLKRAYPQASIDAVVFAGTEGVLTGNPDLSEIVSMPQRPSLFDTLSVFARLFRRYDLAVSVQTGDRPVALAVIAGRQSAGPIEADGLASKLKGFFLSRHYVRDPRQHRVRDILRLAEVLGINAYDEVVCPPAAPISTLAPPQPYAVIHAAPMFIYKRWNADGWRTLAAALRERGFAVVISGAAADRDYLDETLRDAIVTRLDGRLTWPELTALVAGARVYIGPDTAITHLAAAAGAPTVAIYGPTDPRLWGPWPIGGLDRIWQAAGTIQRRSNVWLVQNPLPCMPCQLEGCERRLDSHSQCLDELRADQVLVAVDQALGVRQAA
jgi:heptosyltransferase-3